MTQDQIAEFAAKLNQFSPGPMAIKEWLAANDSKAETDGTILADQFADLLFDVRGITTLDTDVKREITELFSLLSKSAQSIVWSGICRKVAEMNPGGETKADGLYYSDVREVMISSVEGDEPFMALIRAIFGMSKSDGVTYDQNNKPLKVIG